MAETKRDERNENIVGESKTKNAWAVRDGNDVGEAMRTVRQHEEHDVTQNEMGEAL